MDFVNIGHAGNTADTTGYGAVGHDYRIGKYEVTADQWNAVIAADSRVGNIGFGRGSQPTGNASWPDAVRFCNWLTTGNAYTGAYKCDSVGNVIGVMSRADILADGGLFYVLPTEDEWYKAAYFKADGNEYTTYATGNSIPTAGAGGENYSYINKNAWAVGTGVQENNGTFDMNGNVWEWNESSWDSDPDKRIRRGGSYLNDEINMRSSIRFPNLASDNYFDLGFRVAAIPEPSSALLIAIIGGLGLFVRRHFPSV